MEKTRDAGVFTPFVNAIGTALEPLDLEVLHGLFSWMQMPQARKHRDAATWVEAIAVWELRRRANDLRPFPLDDFATWDDSRIADLLNGLLGFEERTTDELLDVAIRAIVKLAAAECYFRLKTRRIVGLN